jgi:hypothetical protein
MSFNPMRLNLTLVPATISLFIASSYRKQLSQAVIATGYRDNQSFAFSRHACSSLEASFNPAR